MIGILIIIYVIPFIALILLVYAIIWGLSKSKNRKRYFTIFGCIVGTILLLVSTLFIDYKSIIITALTDKKVPDQYNEYPYLGYDTITANYSIQQIGEAIQTIYTDSLTNNTIITTRDIYLESRDVFLRIDSAGNFLGTFFNSHDLYSNGRFLLNEKGYSDWFVTGDSILRAYTPIEEVQNRKSFSSWYSSADFVKYLSDSIFVLHKDGVWYSGKQDFIEYYNSDDKEYPEKSDFAYAGLKERRANIISFITPEYNWEDQPFLTFKHCPDSIANGDLLFEYFGKEEYYSGFSHFLSGIGSPNGRGYHPAKWFGTAYCSLWLENTYVPFAYAMDLITDDDEEQYEMNLAIYKGKNYAILRGKYGTYLIRVKK